MSLNTQGDHEDMVVKLEKAPLYGMVMKWAAKFKRGRESHNCSLDMNTIISRRQGCFWKK